MTIADVRRTRSGLTRGLSGFVLLALASAGGPARADPVPVLAILPIRILDTSGEPQDQARQHEARLAAMADALSARLSRENRLRVVGISPEALARACPEPTTSCILATARERGAGIAFVGVVHKSSTLIMQMFARIVETGSGTTTLTRDLNFRGDTDESWQRMTDFLAREIEADPAVGR